MATNSMIPYSNPAGNNQTTPSVGAASTAVPAALPGGTTPMATAAGPAAASNTNPLVPTTTAAGSVPSAVGSNPQTQSELSSIFGTGEASLINNFLSGVGGTQSQVLTEYINSLAPQQAAAQAQTNTALGAGGVSANSSVNAIAQSNLAAQEESTIAAQSASLTETGEQMQESMIQGLEAPAEQYTTDEAMMPYELGAAAISAGGNIGAALIKRSGE